MTAAIVIVSGTIGAVARYVFGAIVQRRADPDLPIGTAVVNLAGALLFGLVVGRGVTGSSLAGLGGLFAGLTTYSTWMVETVALGKQGVRGRVRAVVNLAGMMAAGLTLAWFGIVLGRWIG